MTNQTSPSQKLLTIMCRPIARLCLKNMIGVQQAIEAIKSAFLECAAQSIETGGNKVNISRLSIATGLHRRDVMRLLKEGSESTPKQEHSLNRIIATWENHPEYTTKQGKARVLSYEGNDSEFNRLVRSITSDLHPGTVLFQLEQIGALEKTIHGVKLINAGESVRNDPGKAYHLLAQDMEDLPLAVEENILGIRALPHLHARTEYDNVFEDALPRIEAWLLKEGSLLHQRARSFISQFDRDLHPHKQGRSRCRIALITFSLSRSPEKGISSKKETI